jgi:hypothetical protein
MLPAERTWEASAVSQPRSATMEITLRNLLILCLMVAGLLAACTRPASKPSVVNATLITPGITIDQVQVNQGAGVYVTGRSTLSDGECVQTELTANQKVVQWWPRDVCVEINANKWEILAALGNKGAPKQLEPNVDYEIHAWNPKDPSATSARFPFHLNGSK